MGRDVEPRKMRKICENVVQLFDLVVVETNGLKPEVELEGVSLHAAD